MDYLAKSARPAIVMAASGMCSGGRIVNYLNGFSAHADQKDLLNFVGRIPKAPQQVRIVHGDDGAKATLAQRIKSLCPQTQVVMP